MIELVSSLKKYSISELVNIKNTIDNKKENSTHLYQQSLLENLKKSEAYQEVSTPLYGLEVSHRKNILSQ